MDKLNTPAALVLMLTNRCNLSCIFCGTDSLSSKDKNKEVSADRWIEIIKELADLKVFYITITGGEIFLRKDIFKILEIACKYFPGKVKINTNGTLQNEKDIEQLAKLNFDLIGTSIDGLETTHDKLRGKGNYAKTINFIKRLIKFNVEFEVCFVPTKINYREFSEVISELLKIGVKRFDYNFLSPEGRSCENYKEIKLDFPSEYKEFNEIINTVNAKYNFNFPKKYDKYLNMESKYQKVVNSSRFPNITSPSIFTCSAGKSSCAVLPDGWLIPCSPFVDFKGGNINNTSFKEAWLTSDWQNIRALSKIKTCELEECKTCKYNIICGAGCRGVNYQLTGNLLSADINCPFKK